MTASDPARARARATRPTSDALRRLLDEAAVVDVMVRYCRGIDLLDLDEYTSCFAETLSVAFPARNGEVRTM
ncbi:MAG: nuclear transport factor 2 family protein [Pseudonocardia sp.]|nr:nuclear transport factor 2 family protein [Pseudonocardia sp.]ODU29941.1 MAG: hypothetical protein ABS80_00995 [Pseudonocardia sp. SCN 72-51]ODV08121.1 MAG: hypothetical protein ABT15_05405 [Pseudonocardia sp. SCN 73-27]